MAIDRNQQYLGLSDAIAAWGDPGLVAAVGEAEARVRRQDVAEMGLPDLGRAGQGVQEALRSERAGFKQALRFAWAQLIVDWRRRLEDGEIWLSGVRTGPEHKTGREIIPGVWAAKYHFDWISDIVRSSSHEFVAVRASRSPPDPEPMLGSVQLDPSLTTGADPAWTMDVATLSAEQVEPLLARHADYVCKTIGATLLGPGKATPLALMATKMRERAQTGEIEATITAESKWLAAWAKTATPDYLVVTDKTVRNKLGGLYKQLTRERRQRAG